MTIDIHTTRLEGPDLAGHWGWSCDLSDADASGYEHPAEAESYASAHGPLAADSPRPPAADDDDPPPAANSLLDDRRRQVAERDARREAELPGFVVAAETIGADIQLKVHTAAQMRVMLEAIGGHNNFDEEAAARLLGPFVDQCSTVRIGRDITGPTLYFELPLWTHHTIGAARRCDALSGDRISLADRIDLANRILAVAKTLRADEVSVRQFRSEDGQMRADDWAWNCTGRDPYEIRLWWD